MEASAIPASVGLARTRIAIGASLLRIRSDEQLVTLFREGNDEAFRVIHDRYRARMFAYARQMLGASGQDPEDAVQEIFMRAYYGLRASHRHLALRAWLYRIAHNRCIDDLRRPQPLILIPTEAMAACVQDPMVKIEQRDALRRLISDVQRLPSQQRSALLMRELSGMSYVDVAGALGVSIPAVKSLLVRARVGLAQASEARNTACADIRADLILAHDRGVRASGLARRHLRECPGCRQFRSEVRGVSRQLAGLAPTLGPLGLLANLLGWGGSGAVTGGGALAGGGAAAASGSAVTASGTAAAGGAATSAGLLAGGAGHVVTLLAAAVVTAGGAVEIERTVSKVVDHDAHRAPMVSTAVAHARSGAGIATSAGGSSAQAATGPVTDSDAATPGGSPATPATTRTASTGRATATSPDRHMVPITEILDPDMYNPQNLRAAPTGTPPSGSSGTGTTAPTSSGSTGAGSPATGSATGTPGASTTGSSSSAGSSTATGSTAGSSAASSSGSTSSSGTTAGSSSSSSATSGTSSAPSSNSASTPATGSSDSVGHSTTATASKAVVSFVKHRRPQRRSGLDRLERR